MKVRTYIPCRDLATTVANWAACAPFLAKTAPALGRIVDEDPGPRRSTRDTASAYRRDRALGGPCHGYARPAWDRVRGLGAKEKEKPCRATPPNPPARTSPSRASNARYHTWNTDAGTVNSTRPHPPRFRPPCTPSRVHMR